MTDDELAAIEARAAAAALWPWPFGYTVAVDVPALVAALRRLHAMHATNSAYIVAMRHPSAAAAQTSDNTRWEVSSGRS